PARTDALVGQCRQPRRALSSGTPTSRCRSATAGRRVRARESPPGAGRAAIGTRVALRPRPLPPGARLLNRLTRSRVLRPSRLEPVEDVLRARCRPQGEELVIRIGEGPTAADRHETRVAVFREDHTQQPLCSHLPNALNDAPPLHSRHLNEASHKAGAATNRKGSFEISGTFGS